MRRPSKDNFAPAAPRALAAAAPVGPGRDEPVAEWSRVYEELYPRYRELYPALKPTCDALRA